MNNITEKTIKFNDLEEKIVNEIAEEKKERQINFSDNIKIDTKAVNSVIDKKNFLEEIDGNVEALKLLSVDRLRKLEKYYDNVIEENEKKIKKLKETA